MERRFHVQQALALRSGDPKRLVVVLVFQQIQRDAASEISSFAANSVESKVRKKTAILPETFDPMFALPSITASNEDKYLCYPDFLRRGSCLWYVACTHTHIVLSTVRLS